MVPKHLWERVNAVDSNGYIVATILGPPIAAALVTVVGGPPTLAIIGAMMLLATVPLIGVRDPAEPKPAEAPLLREAWDGVLYVWHNPTLRGLAFSISTLNIAGGVASIAIPLLVLRQLGFSPALVGLAFTVRASPGWSRLPSSDGSTPEAASGGCSWSPWPSWSPPSRCCCRSRPRRRPHPGRHRTAGRDRAGHRLAGTLRHPEWAARHRPVHRPTRRTDPAIMGRAFAVSMAANFVGYPLGSAIAGLLATTSLASAVGLGVSACFVATVFATVLIPARAPSARSRRRLPSAAPPRRRDPSRFTATVSRRRIPDEVLSAAHERAAAREERDWAEADRLRAEIEAAGWKIVDRGTDFALTPVAPLDTSEGERVRYGASANVPSRLDETARRRGDGCARGDRLAGRPGACAVGSRRPRARGHVDRRRRGRPVRGSGSGPRGGRGGRRDGRPVDRDRVDEQLPGPGRRVERGGPPRAPGPIVILFDSSVEPIGRFHHTADGSPRRSGRRGLPGDGGSCPDDLRPVRGSAAGRRRRDRGLLPGVSPGGLRDAWPVRRAVSLLPQPRYLVEPRPPRRGGWDDAFRAAWCRAGRAARSTRHEHRGYTSLPPPTSGIGRASATSTGSSTASGSRRDLLARPADRSLQAIWCPGVRQVHRPKAQGQRHVPGRYP